MDWIDDDGREALRADAPSGLFLSRRGGWYHDGQRVRHRGLEGLLHRSIARAADGSLIVTTGRDTLAFTAEDAPVVVRTLGRDPLTGDVTLELSDGTAEGVALRGFTIDDLGRVRCAVRAREFWGILSRSATQLLLELVDDDGRVRTALGACALSPTTPQDWSIRPG